MNLKPASQLAGFFMEESVRNLFITGHTNKMFVSVFIPFIKI